MAALFGKRGRSTPITLDVQPVMQEELSAREFLRLAQTNPGIIKSSRAILPKQGRRGFGSFLVQYVYPRHTTSS